MAHTPSSKILFAAYGGGHVAMLAPVLVAMAKRGFETRTLALTTAQAYLARQGIPYFGYRDLPEAATLVAQRYGRELVSETPSPGSPVPYEESVAYHGINFLELVETHGEAGAWEAYEQRQRQAFLPYRCMTRLLQRERPDLVVITNSPRTEQALAMAGRFLGIPVVCLVDLFELHGLPKHEYREYADKFLVLNEEVRRSFIARGCKPDQVVVTGNPAFDGLQSVASRAKGAQLRTAKGWPSSDKVILWASQIEPTRHPFNQSAGDPALPRKVEQALREFVQTVDGVRLVVRYHPSERVDFVAGDKVDFSPPEENLDALLHAVDIVVVMTSTVGLQAAIAGKQVISVDTSVLFPDAPFSRMGISQGVESLDGLIFKLREVLSHSRGSRFAGRATPPALAKVCDELEAILTVAH